jgi:hypothetical protein
VPETSKKGKVMKDIPAGYERTGKCDGHTVVCRSEDFVRFTRGVNNDHLGFVLVDGDMVSLRAYKRFTKEIERLEAIVEHARKGVRDLGEYEMMIPGGQHQPAFRGAIVGVLRLLGGESD